MVQISTGNNAYFTRESHFDRDRMAGSMPVWKQNNDVKDDSASALSLTSKDSVGKQSAIAPSLSFGEMIDVVNPLHHLPVVGNVYRSLTQDDISPVAKIAGGALYGGAIGGAVSLLTAAVEEHSGQSVSGAVRSAAGSDKHSYTLEDDPRTAGHNHQKTDHSSNTPHTTRLSDITWSQQPSQSVLARLESEERQPVTEVSIKVADNQTHKRQSSFHFNA